jgi:hypothetical protein
MQKIILALALASAPVRHPRATQNSTDSECGVTGHTVIVHKGCPANSDDPCDPGVRIGCCVLA